VYNGIDPTPFDAVPKSRIQALRTELGVGEAPCVGVFSRLAPWKGQHVLLDALTCLPEVHALVVGEALFDGDQEYAQSLRNRVSGTSLEGRVHFLGFRADVPALMKTVDAVVHTSTAPEPFGRVIVEGLLAGRPVVATRQGGAMEIIERDDIGGYLLSPGDANELAHTLDRILCASPSGGSMVETGNQIARERFSVESMVNGIERVVAEVVNNQNPHTCAAVN